MVGMIEPRRLIITTLSFLPTQRGRHSNGARHGNTIERTTNARECPQQRLPATLLSPWKGLLRYASRA